MAEAKTAGKTRYIVCTKSRLNVREAPSKASRVLRTLANKQRVSVDNSAQVPDGWKALKDGGYVMSEFLK